MPLVLTPSEFLADPNTQHLPTVVEKGAYLPHSFSRFLWKGFLLIFRTYPSVEEYLNTYIRLLREDCFFELREGVKNILEGKSTTMNIFTNIRFSGIQFLGNRGICYCLKFTPMKKVKSWNDTSQLQYPLSQLYSQFYLKYIIYGNLLCISTNGKFDNPIWASVCCFLFI